MKGQKEKIKSNYGLGPGIDPDYDPNSRYRSSSSDESRLRIELEEAKAEIKRLKQEVWDLKYAASATYNPPDL